MHSPILEAIKSHNARGRASFHMPGHKGTAPILEPLSELLGADITELPDTGSLFDGRGPTAQAERLAAEAFASKASFMSAGGCTLCIQAMFRLVAPTGGRVICGRTIHRAAVNAMALLGIEPLWILPDHSGSAGFAGRTTPAAVRQAMEDNSGVKAIYLTSPDYFGVMSDLPAIVAVADEFGIPVLVDNAHGAHLGFLTGYKSPVACGAAMSADSAHKTLPVLTGGAWLNIGDNRFVLDARDAMALFGSTSPSYPILLSLDLCRVWLAQDGARELARVRAAAGIVKDKLAALGYALPAGVCDPLRIAFRGGKIANAYDVGEVLRHQGIEPEYAGTGGVILIPSLCNTQEDFNRLMSAIEAMARLCPPKPETLTPVTASLPPVVMTPREALLSASQTVELSASVGRVAALAECPCPPAIPAVMPGERVTAEICQALSEYGIKNITVVK